MDDVIDEEGVDLSPAEAAIAADLRAAFLVDPDPTLTERHVAAMVAARRARLAPPAISLATHRTRKALVAAGLAGAVVLGSAGVAAAAGGLPDGLQRAVASAIRPVGIHLPVPAERKDDNPDEPTTTVPDPTTSLPGSTSTTAAAGDPQPGDDNPSAPPSTKDDGNGSGPHTPPTSSPKSSPGDGHQGDPGNDHKGDGNGGGGDGSGSGDGGSGGDGHGGGG